MKTLKLATFAACALSASLAQATILFQETFDDNSAGWTGDSGFSISGGTLSVSSPDDYLSDKFYGFNFGQVTGADLETGSYTISYDAKFNEPWVGFFAGIMWEDNSGQRIFNGASKEYDVNVLAESSSFGSYKSGSNIVWSDPIVYSFNEWFHVDVVFSGGQVSVYQDSSLLYTDAAINMASMDRFNFWGHRANAEFDNLIISSNAVPEPTTLAIMGLGLAGLIRTGKRKKA